MQAGLCAGRRRASPDTAGGLLGPFVRKVRLKRTFAAFLVLDISCRLVVLLPALSFEQAPGHGHLRRLGRLWCRGRRQVVRRANAVPGEDLALGAVERYPPHMCSLARKSEVQEKTVRPEDGALAVSRVLPDGDDGPVAAASEHVVLCQDVRHAGPALGLGDGVRPRSARCILPSSPQGSDDLRASLPGTQMPPVVSGRRASLEAWRALYRPRLAGRLLAHRGCHASATERASAGLRLS